MRFRELSEILPRLEEKRIYARVVTSAVRPIPIEWAGAKFTGVVVSIDGLQPEHDERRKPATYDRILKHIEGHRIVVHCTVTSRMMQRQSYLEEFVDFWSGRPEVKGIEVSFFTPQVGETSAEILTREMREAAVRDSGVAQAPISQAGAEPVPPGRVFEPASKPVGVHLRVDHGVPVPRSEDRGLALPIRRQPQVQRVRLPRLHRPSRRGRAAAGARVEAPKHLQRVPSRRTVGASRSRAAKNVRLNRFPASVPFDAQGLRENPSLSDDVEVSAMVDPLEIPSLDILR